MDDMLQIGEVAELVGLSLRTIRHYGELGVVEPSGRTAGGFRLYTDRDVERLRLVKAMKPLDFSLEEMRQALEARDRLGDDTLPQEERAEARDRLAMFAALTNQRCERLRDQLASAETMAELLVREVGDRHG